MKFGSKFLFSSVAIASKIFTNIFMFFVEDYDSLPSLLCFVDTARGATVGTQMWSSERRVAILWFVQSYVSLDKKYTEENLNFFALKYTSFFSLLLKFVFLEGDKFQIYVILSSQT